MMALWIVVDLSLVELIKVHIGCVSLKNFAICFPPDFLNNIVFIRIIRFLAIRRLPEIFGVSRGFLLVCRRDLWLVHGGAEWSDPIFVCRRGHSVLASRGDSLSFRSRCFAFTCRCFAISTCGRDSSASPFRRDPSLGWRRILPVVPCLNV